MKAITDDNKKYMIDFIKYILSIQFEQGRGVFVEYAGHVDWLTARISVSPEQYNDVIWDSATNYTNTKAFDKETVDKFKEEIELALKEQLEKEQELDMLEKLKAKYEPKEDVIEDKKDE